MYIYISSKFVAYLSSVVKRERYLQRMFISTLKKKCAR